ncbi:MAG: N-acyl homoserine lactonase family protein [Actinomycetota bacterium]
MTYEVHAIKYAERAARRPEHFVGGDPHDEPMDMDYFIWVLKPTPGGDDRPVWVVDTGFDRLDAERRNRNLVRPVNEGLAALDVDAAAVEQVILTHLHYDHVGGFARFPNARFHLQDREMSYASGRYMTHEALNHAYTPDHIADLVHLVYGDRVVFHDGDAELADGLSVHLVGGHTMGLQVVRVRTGIGWIVLASDASHFYENMLSKRPFPIIHDLGAMLEGYRRCGELADDPRFVVPGHDPLVFDRYPPSAAGLEGIAARLDVVPTGGDATTYS